MAGNATKDEADETGSIDNTLSRQKLIGISLSDDTYYDPNKIVGVTAVIYDMGNLDVREIIQYILGSKKNIRSYLSLQKITHTIS